MSRLLEARRPPRGYRVALRAAERDPSLAEGLALARATARRLGIGSRFRSDEATDRQGRQIAERVSLDARHRVAALADRLLSGEIGRDAWSTRMRDLIVPRIYAGVVAVLGPDLTSNDIAYTQNEIRRQLGFLKRFSSDIESGDQSFDGTIRSRADHYGSAAWVAGQGALLNRAVGDGFSEARRILGVADHCRTHGGLEGCIEQAGRGWQPIDQVKPIGESPCRSRCHCHLEFR